MVMGSRSKFIVSLAIIFASFVSQTQGLEHHHHHHEELKRLFVFGDSLFDTGNNQYLDTGSDYVAGGRWPYGMTFFNQPTGRVSDGRLVPDFIASYANLDLPVPFLQPGAVFIDGANFASAGAGTLEIYNNAINIREQLDNFKSLATRMEQILGQREAQKVLNRAVYLFSIGGNDYFNFNANNKEPTMSDQIEYIGWVMSNLTYVLEEVYALGGRKFGFQNVGPLGCLPIIRQRSNELEVDCIDRFMRHARLHNNFLSTVLDEFEQDFPGFKYAIFDYYTVLRNMILHPKEYGFKEGQIACCGTGPLNGGNCSGGSSGVEYHLCSDPNEHVFFDGAHTSDKTNLKLALQMWDGSKEVTGPHYNVKNLFEL